MAADPRASLLVAEPVPEVRTVRHVAGFGRMAWLEPDQLEPGQKPSLRS